MPRCSHNQWVEVARHYTAPNRNIRSLNNVSERLLQRMVGGWTNVEMRCVDCGDLKFIEVEGKA